MKNHVQNAVTALVLVLGVGLSGCEEEKKPEPAAPAVSALQPAAEPAPSVSFLPNSSCLRWGSSVPSAVHSSRTSASS